MDKLTFFLIIFIVGIVNFGLQAQTEQFVPGYYITPQKDTIRGYINYRSKLFQPNSFFFKVSPEQSTASKFSPEEVHSFHFAPDGYFQSVVVENEGKEELKFLQKLVSGYAELFQENRSGGPVFILTMASGEKIQLEKKDTIVDGKVKLDRRYFGQMMYLFRDCESLLESHNRQAQFTQGMLARFVYNYNKCAHPERPTALLITGKFRFRFGGTAGFSTVKGEAQSGLLQLDGLGTGFMGGIFMDLYFFKLVSLRTGLQYISFETSGTRTFSFGADVFSHQYRSLEIPITAHFQFSSRKLAPYIYAGINLPLNISITETFQRTEFGSVTIDRESESAVERYIFMITGGAGLRYSLTPHLGLFLNFGYDYKDAMTNSSMVFRPQRFSLNAGIVF